jgi:hypothetical protein
MGKRRRFEFRSLSLSSLAVLMVWILSWLVASLREETVRHKKKSQLSVETCCRKAVYQKGEEKIKGKERESREKSLEITEPHLDSKRRENKKIPIICRNCKTQKRLRLPEHGGRFYLKFSVLDRMSKYGESGPQSCE